MKINILIDTGFWIALFAPRDDPSQTLIAEKIARDIEDFTLIIPYPTLYEFVNSRLSRRDERDQFENFIKRSNLFKLDDSKYREMAFENFFIKMKDGFADVSFVDEVIKLMLEDKNLKIDYLVSFDIGLINSAHAINIKSLS